MTPEKERKTKMAFERIQYHALRQNLMKGIQIPFSIQIPKTECCPTCYFDKNNHITLEFM